LILLKKVTLIFLEVFDLAITLIDLTLIKVVAIIIISF